MVVAHETSPHTVDDRALAHLERLARLVIEPSERQDLKRDLVELLGFVDSLLAADVEGVEEYGHDDPESAAPLASQSPAAGAERADEVKGSLPSATALAMAPAVHECFFKVPRTVEEG